MSLYPKDSLYLWVKSWRAFFRIFGLAPYSFDGDPQEMRLVCRLQDRLWSAFWMLLIFIHVVIYCTGIPITISISKNKYFTILQSLIMSSEYATATSILAPAVYRKDPKTKDFFSEMALVEQSFKREDAYGRIWPSTLSFIMFEMVCICASLGVQLLFFNGAAIEWFFMIVHCITVLIVTLDFCQFVLVVLLLKRRYETINEQLHYSTEHKVGTTNSLQLHSEVQQLRQAYAHLYQASRKLSFIYGVPILLGSLWCFLAVVFFSIAVIHLNKYPSDFIASICAVCLSVCTLAVVCVTCHMTNRKSLETRVLIQQLLLDTDMDAHMEKILKSFAKQATVMKASFTACDLVDIGFPLFCTIFGAACTYIIVFEQLRLIPN